MPVEEATYVHSPFGWFEVRGSEDGITRVQLLENPPEGLPSPESKCVEEGARQLSEYFEGSRKYFKVKINWSGATTFNQMVWEALLQIPYGHTVSYSDIAAQIGKPDAVRAVGLANRNNPIAIIVPCHRVIGKKGALTGYFYGLDMKMALLGHENPASFGAQGTLF